ncbi:MAG: ELKS/Rab6-interacting/CAST family protein [Treponema sp.]|jgi:hypothetical protein|nr:ELKS/Rab6-interacting/CAST family protein [Treponema sp.]
MAIVAQVHQPEKRPTFEDVWAAILETEKRFQETDKRFQESRAEHDRMIAETEKRFQESRAEHDRMIAETNKAIKEMSARVDRVTQNVGGLNRSIGELVETLIAARLWEKFAFYPYQLKRAYQRVPVYDERNQQKTDIDILLSDTEWCMAVEVKREADDKDVDHHLRRMKLIRQYPPLEVVSKRLLGAIAGGVVLPDTVEYAHKAGFFVLTLTGESVTLLDTPTGFVAREW